MTEFILQSVMQANAYAPGLQPAKAVAKLNTNESPYRPSPQVVEAVMMSIDQLNRYPQPDSDSLCRLAAEVYGVAADEVLACNGGDEGLSVIMRSIIGPGDKILILSPTYPFYATLASLQGAVVESISFADIVNGLIPNDVKLTIFARPNSPCGQRIDRDIIARWKGPLLIDEAYAEFVGESVVDLIAEKPDLMILRTLSKAYGLAGLRIGFVLGQAKVISQLRKVRGVYTVDRLAAAAAVAVFKDQSYLSETIRKITVEREKLLDELRSLGFTVKDTGTNFLWLPKFDVDIFDRLTQAGIHIRKLQHAEGVGARITIGTPEENRTLISALHRIIKDRVVNSSFNSSEKFYDQR
jgi:histidinol-phosphate aminotransferase